MFVKGNTIFRYWFNVNTLFMNVYGSVSSRNRFLEVPKTFRIAQNEG